MARRIRSRHGGLALALALGLGAALPGAAVEPPAAAPAAALARALEAFVRERAPQPPSAVEIPELADFVVPGLGTDAVQVELSANPREDYRGAVPIRIVLRERGVERKQGVVTLGVRTEGTLWVAARPLQRGATVGASDVSLERRDLAEVPEGWLGEGAAVVGQRTLRHLDAGQPLSRESLGVAPSVQRGQRVRIQLERGPLRIEALGEARAEGRPGDTIRVVNLDSRRELFGRVGSDGVVHVEF